MYGKKQFLPHTNYMYFNANPTGKPPQHTCSTCNSEHGGRMCSADTNSKCPVSHWSRLMHPFSVRSKCPSTLDYDNKTFSEKNKEKTMQSDLVLRAAG